MPTAITLCISMAAALFGSVMGKYYTSQTKGSFPVFLYSATTAFVAAFVFLLWGGIGEISNYTVWMGIAFGIITALQGVASMWALRIGPMSYTNVLLSFSTLITALSGTLFFGETIGVLQIVGLVLMIGSFVCSVEKKENEKEASWRWLLLCLIALCAGGGIGLMQKSHQASVYKGELNAFLIVAFNCSCLISLVLALWMKGKEQGDLFPKKTEKGKKTWILGAVMVIAGVCGAANNKWNLYLSGVMPSAVFFPIVNGGGLVLSVLAAVVIFREKLTKKQWLGIVLGILSVLSL